MVWSRWCIAFVRAVLDAAVRAAGTLALAGIIIGLADVVWRLVRALSQGAGTGPPREALLVGGIVWVSAAVVAGVWLGFMWSHTRARWIALGWLVLLMGLPLVVGSIIFLDYLSASSMGGSVSFEYAWNTTRRNFAGGYIILPAAWAVSVCMVMPGQWMGAAWTRRWMRLKWRRARSRRNRSWKRQLLARA
jgi:hypothetical protein